MERPAAGIDFSGEDRLAVSQNQKKGFMCYEVYVFLLQETSQMLHVFFFLFQDCALTKGFSSFEKGETEAECLGCCPLFCEVFNWPTPVD